MQPDATVQELSYKQLQSYICDLAPANDNQSYQVKLRTHLRTRARAASRSSHTGIMEG
jgi:hypothetical protein